MLQLFALISAVLVLIGIPPYIRDMLRGVTKPERATWFILSVLGVIAFGSQVALGGTWSLVFSGLDALATLMVFALSIRYGVGGWTTLDKIALLIAAAGVLIACIAREPIIALAGVILADISGTFLTVIKTYIEPSSETTITWLLTGTAALFGILAVGKTDPGLLLYPLYLMMANYVIPITQWLGYSSKKRNS